MSVKRICILFAKEFKQGVKSFFFTQAVATPILSSLFVAILFGTLLVSTPKIGILDKGQSEIITLFKNQDYILLKEYDTLKTLKKEVTTGILDVGIVLPEYFDKHLSTLNKTEIELFFYGEAFIKDQAAILARLNDYIFKIARFEKSVKINRITLGSGKNKPWNERLMPFVIIIAIMMGGILLPASSLVEEKHKKTLTALTCSPASLLEVIISKGMMGFMVSMMVAVIVLFMNNLIQTQFALLISVLALGAAFSTLFGLFLGTLAKDINTLFTIVKSIMLFLYAPAILKIWPEIPEWVGRLFPTNYLIEPVLMITEKNAGFSDIVFDFFMLTGMVACGIIILTIFVKKKMRYTS